MNKQVKKGDKMRDSEPDDSSESDDAGDSGEPDDQTTQ